MNAADTPPRTAVAEPHLPVPPPIPAPIPPPLQQAPPVRASIAINVIATLSVIVALWWGQRFLIPLAAGLMLAMLVMPVALRETAVTGSSAVLNFAGNLSIIFFVAFFVLIGGQALSTRFLDLWGDHPQAHDRAQRAVVECARQIRIYAGVLLVTNTAVGVAVWAAFSLADLPDAVGWGVTAAVLHVVPYIGMALLTGLGAAETFLAHESITAALGMAGFLVLMSTLIGILVTAWLQGRAAKMNPAAVFIGLMFWGALWGVWGLFLGPALVVLLKVVAENLRSGHRLATLMRG